MEVVLRIVVGLLLIAHGLVHLLYFVTNAGDPKWPFALDRSRAVPERARRRVAITLIAATIVAFVLLGLAVWGAPGLAAVWPVLAVVAAGFSLAVLVLFWNARLIAGVAIDVALIVVALWRPEWTDRIGG